MRQNKIVLLRSLPLLELLPVPSAEPSLGPTRPGRRFHCQTCGKGFQTRGTFNRHSRYECQKEKMHKCVYCVYSCHQGSNLRRHIRLKHGIDYVHSPVIHF
ncbi:hypothetical protein HUJ04_008539 [Dendroctonus ponderosae]|nr:hypothetical protein HUJ04_008539 [Dendroctonus ponderosae]